MANSEEQQCRRAVALARSLALLLEELQSRDASVQRELERMEAEYVRQIDKARQCVADAMVLLKEEKTGEAKELDQEGDAARKKALQILTQMKEAATRVKTEPVGRRVVERATARDRYVSLQRP
jgi:uncharacterized small protein (DUF1192 family)